MLKMRLKSCAGGFQLLFDGRAFAKEKEEKLKTAVEQLKQKGIVPELVSILVGNNPESELYLSLKAKFAKRIGVIMELQQFPPYVEVEEIVNFIKETNEDVSVHGVMVQLPIIVQSSKCPPLRWVNKVQSCGRNFEIENEILNSIAREKDVDGQRMDSKFLPATVKAVWDILEVAGGVAGKKVVVIGSKGAVGEPLLNYLKHQNCSEVKGFDKETDDLEAVTKSADVLISATGVPNLIKKEMVKQGAVVVDVGITKCKVAEEETIICGDVEKRVEEVAGFLTPVPGGVGPVTVACLFENLCQAAFK